MRSSGWIWFARAWTSVTRTTDDLILIESWRGSLIAILCGVVVSFVLFGFFWPYWRVFDMDAWMIYEGWLVNDRLPQEWFDHPGYWSILLLGGWFHLLHVVGVLSVDSLSAVPAAVAEAGRAWQAATQAGRVLSLLLSSIYVVAFAALLRRLTGDWRIAILAAFVLAFSGGMAMNQRIIRTELIASAGTIIALLLLMVAARERSNWRPALVGLAAFAATIGLENKIQVIFLICALPLLVVPFGEPREDVDAFRKSPRSLWITAALAGCAVLLVIPAARLVEAGLAAAPSAGFHPVLMNTFGAYQIAIAVWIIASIIAFALWWRVTARETIATALCVVIGIAGALLMLHIRYATGNVVVIINPLEQLLHWSRVDPLAGGVVSSLLNGIGAVATTRTFVLAPSARPTIFLEWFVVIAAIVAWRAGHRRLVAQVAILMLTVWGLDAISAVRGLKLQYFIITDPLVIVAAALLLAQVPGLRTYRHAYWIGLLLLATHVAISQAEPIKHTFLKSVPTDYCTPHFGYTKRVERFPFCPAP